MDEAAEKTTWEYQPLGNLDLEEQLSIYYCVTLDMSFNLFKLQYLLNIEDNNSRNIKEMMQE